MNRTHPRNARGAGRPASAWILVALAVLCVVPTTQAATGYLSLSPGDAIDATDGPGDRDLRIHTLLGQSVLVVDTPEPSIVAVRLQHADDSTTTHFVQTVAGGDPALAAAVAQLQAALSVQADRLIDVQAQLANATATAHATADAVAQQRLAVDLLADNLTDARDDLDALRVTASDTQATAQAATAAVRNIRIPDYTPVIERMDRIEDHAEAAKGRLVGLYVIAALTLMAAIGAFLHAVWQTMGGNRPSLDPRGWWRRLKGDQDNPTNDSAPAPPRGDDVAHQMTQGEALAAELLPGPDTTTPAGPGDQTDALPDATTAHLGTEAGQEDASGGVEPTASGTEPDQAAAPPAPNPPPLRDERLAQALQLPTLTDPGPLDDSTPGP